LYTLQVGQSGSGKTTIIRLLFRLYDVNDGQIKFNGTEIRSLKLKSLRDQIGIVPQDTVLFNETIKYNILYGQPTASDEEVEEAAKAAAIHQFILSHPDGMVFNMTRSLKCLDFHNILIVHQ
jgi:ABC-type multidrug transport system fused ATPase/permease subunit